MESTSEFLRRVEGALPKGKRTGYYVTAIEKDDLAELLRLAKAGDIAEKMCKDCQKYYPKHNRQCPCREGTICDLETIRDKIPAEKEAE